MQKKIILPALLILIVLGAVGAFFGYKQIQAKKNPTVAAQTEIKDLIAKVGKLIELPASEVPTVATVSDINKLKGQAFFARAQNGDKVMIYAKSKKAILYRPSLNKIIEVAFYNPPEAAQTTPTPSEAAAKVRVAVYNGTKTAGLARTVADQLSAKFPNIEIGNTANAAGDYTQTLVIDLSGSNKDLAQALATQLNGKVGSLPSSEAKPDSADIFVIVGSK